MGDYQKEMNSDNYMQWVQKTLILNLLYICVFIIDSAVYHNVLSEKCQNIFIKKGIYGEPVGEEQNTTVVTCWRQNFMLL